MRMRGNSGSVDEGAARVYGGVSVEMGTGSAVEAEVRLKLRRLSRFDFLAIRSGRARPGGGGSAWT